MIVGSAMLTTLASIAAINIAVTYTTLTTVLCLNGLIFSLHRREPRVLASGCSDEDRSNLS
ncbi:hypothetical protein QKW52_11645 [Bacillus sonorensis]|nr:hypothetical protein [Bacillus sonorensis]